jgi:hypothetical protein
LISKLFRGGPKGRREGEKGWGEGGERRIFKEKMKYTLEANNV